MPQLDPCLDEYTYEECCDVGAALRQWLMEKLAQWVGERVHQDHVPQPEDHERTIEPCQLQQSYIWFSRSDVERERCLAGNNAPDTESFDVEIIGHRIDVVQCAARRLQECDAYQGRFGDIWAQSVFVEDQSDTYQYRGIAEDYLAGGLETAAFRLEICPICLTKE